MLEKLKQTISSFLVSDDRGTSTIELCLIAILQVESVAMLEIRMEVSSRQRTW